jgi:hypothetical protein
MLSETVVWHGKVLLSVFLGSLISCGANVWMNLVGWCWRGVFRFSEDEVIFPAGEPAPV